MGCSSDGDTLSHTYAVDSKDREEAEGSNRQVVVVERQIEELERTGVLNNQTNSARN